MSVLDDAVRAARNLPNLAWQISAIPGQLMTSQGRRPSMPFLAAVGGAAVLGVVDWPVALLVTAGYLLQRPATATEPTAVQAAGTTAAAAARYNEPGRRPQRKPAATVNSTGSPADQADADQTVTGQAVTDQTVTAPRRPGSAPSEQEASLQASRRTSQRRDEPPATAADQQPEDPRFSSSAEQPAAQPAQQDPPLKPTTVPPTDSASKNQSAERSQHGKDGQDGQDVREPWPGYATLTVRQVLERLDNDGVDLGAVTSYERAHRNRKSVHTAISQRHGTAH